MQTIVRLWRETLDKGKFWKWARLSVNPSSHPEQKETLIHSSKLAIIREIWIEGPLDKPLTEAVLQAISDGATPQLETLYINGAVEDGVDIDAGVVSRAVIKVENCWIEYGHHRQLEAIFNAVIQSTDLTLKQLTFEDP